MRTEPRMNTLLRQGSEGQANRHACSRGKSPWVSISVHSWFALLLVAALGNAATFDVQRKAIEATLVTQPESAIVALLKAGIAEGKPAPAFFDARQWLGKNAAKDPLTVYYAARAADLSCAWKEAVALYEQYLKEADVTSATADKALYALYTLLDRIGDTSEAYRFNKAEGNRLVACPRAKQFDKIFLDEAVQRNDPWAVAGRLLACGRAGYSQDLLAARYDNYYRWLLDRLNGPIEKRDAPPSSQSFADTCEKLAATITFSEELRLTLAWAASVRYYNLAKVSGEDVEPPLAEAKALLARYPQYARWVQDGWAGGGRGGERNDPKKYWPHKIDAKMATVLAAADKLAPLERIELQQSWQARYYERGPQVQDVKVVSDLIAAPPAWFDGRTDAVALRKNMEDVTFEEVSKGAPADERIAAFKKLWQDYQSPQPKIPAVYDRLKRIVKITPELVPTLLKSDRPQAELLVRSAIAEGMDGQDPKWEKIDGARPVTVSYYHPFFDRLADSHGRGDLWRLKKWHKNLYGMMHPLEGVLRQAMLDGIKAGKLASWKVIAWVNMQSPENNDEQVKVARAIVGSPVWKDLSFEAQFCLREWFNKAGMPSAEAAWIDAGNSGVVWKDVKALTKDADVATTVAALTAVRDGMKKAPVKVGVSADALDKLAEVPDAVFKDPKVMGLILDIVDETRFFERRDPQPFAERLFAYVSSKRDPLVVHRTADILWGYAASRAHGRQYGRMRDFNKQLIDQHPAAAYALARVGVDIVSLGWDVWRHGKMSQHVPEMKAMEGKAAMKLGLVKIPVPVTHPAYPIYQAQADWTVGNEKAAWAGLKANWEELLPVHRKLSADFMLWVLQRTMYNRDDARMEAVVKPLLAWVGEDPETWSVSQRIDLEIAYGDIALQLGKLNDAHRIFIQTQNNKAYAKTVDRHKATLRRVKVERLAKRYDDALRTLDSLDTQRIQEMWAPARYARAEVYYDMEEFDDAADAIEAILARDPDHPNAKILQGKLQLERQKLMEASELDIGSKNAKDTVMPGEKIKVTLLDPTLEVSGAGTEAEVVVWTSTGDREYVMLGQFGDKKTKFRGEVLTALGPPNPGDRVLQVIGDDKIYYAYSERFLKKMPGVDASQGGPITVASDALLIASARELLSEAEQRVADAAGMMEALKSPDDKAARAVAMMQAARKAGGTAAERSADETRAQQQLADELASDRVKPGGAINVRVIDPDASRTADIDEVTVSVSSSSGDAIGRVVLRETGTHTGWFEGKVPTAGAQATATASSSAPGLDPNMVISPKTSHPAWRPIPDEKRKPKFTIDLNDNVELGAMTITAAESGAKLKNFMVEIGTGQGNLRAAGFYPRGRFDVEKPWHPSVTVIHDEDWHQSRNARSVYEFRDIQTHMDRGWFLQTYPQGVVENVAGPSAAMDKSIPEKVSKMRYGWRREGRHRKRAIQAHVIYRFQGYFHEPRVATRRFKLVLGSFTPPKNRSEHPQFLLAVDGKVITSKENPNLEGEIVLEAGLHRFEIWGTGWVSSIGFGRSVQLLANLGDGSTLKACPDSFFDPATFPKGSLKKRDSIKATDDGKQFEIAFAPGSSARILNVVVKDQEGPVPALNKVALTDSKGKRVLPVEHDYAELRKNDQLEILTGDTVAVRYVDDRFVSKAKQRHERLLRVAYANARIGFNSIRFPYGKPLFPSVSDPDMDVTDKPDTVPVVLESPTGGKKTFMARELGDSTGNFQVTVIPVPGVPKAANEFQVGEGESIQMIYRDAENVNPGVPINRTTSIEHAVYAKPKMRLAHATVAPLDDKTFTADNPGPERQNLTIGFATAGEIEYRQERAERAAANSGLLAAEAAVAPITNAPPAGGDLIKPRWLINSRWVDVNQPPPGGLSVVHGQRVYLEIEAPHLIFGERSFVDVYLQTETGREQYRLLRESLGGGTGETTGSQPPPPPPFDIRVPGTIKQRCFLSGRRFRGNDPDHVYRSRVPQLAGYLGGDKPLATDGSKVYKTRSRTIFTCSVPLMAGFMPEQGAADDAGKPIPTQFALVVQPGDHVHIGLRYQDGDGKEQWMTVSAKVLSLPILDVMGEDYREDVRTAYVGDKLHLRVVDIGADISDASDTVHVLMQAKSGAKHPVELLEVDSHSGVFKGSVELTYATKQQDAASNAVPYDVKRNGFPVVYGDLLGVGYKDRTKQKAETILLRIHKGADGTVTPFAKRFRDPKVAAQTKFWMAEGYLEMAKRHRRMGESKLAADEYARAKDLLEKAMEQFRDPATRAQAEYLLGNLTQEEAEATKDKELAEVRFRAALSRYMRVTGNYPDTVPASKAQFKIATVYEELNEPDIAAQEYGKLAYKYPNSEFLALAMGRLGAHFWKKAAGYEKRAKALLAKQDDKDAVFKGRAMEKVYIKEYLNSADIFARLRERFPDHPEAGNSALRAGQAFMRARKIQDALKTFKQVYERDAYDGPRVRAEALYWAGRCNELLGDALGAYALYKRLTFDFPETMWAQYARGQMSQGKLAEIDTQFAREQADVKLKMKGISNERR